MKISSQYIWLRPVAKHDAELMHALNKIPAVVKYTGEAPWTLAKAKDFCAGENLENMFLVFKCTDNEFMGWCGVRYYDNSTFPNISFRFFPEYWGQGYATEAVEVLLNCLRNQHFNQIRAQVHPQNTYSKKILSTAGFIFLHEITWNNTPWEMWELELVYST